MPAGTCWPARNHFSCLCSHLPMPTPAQRVANRCTSVVARGVLPPARAGAEAQRKALGSSKCHKLNKTSCLSVYVEPSYERSLSVLVKPSYEQAGCGVHASARASLGAGGKRRGGGSGDAVFSFEWDPPFGVHLVNCNPQHSHHHRHQHPCSLPMQVLDSLPCVRLLCQTFLLLFTHIPPYRDESIHFLCAHSLLFCVPIHCYGSVHSCVHPFIPHSAIETWHLYHEWKHVCLHTFLIDISACRWQRSWARGGRLHSACSTT